MPPDRRLRRALRIAVGSALAAGLAMPAAHAADRVLDQLSTDTGSVVIQFNCPMSFVSNYPLRSGDEIRIELQPLPGCAPLSSLGETLPVAKDNPAGLVDLRLDQSLGARRSLTLHFARTVDFLIRPRPGLTGIEVSFQRRAGRSGVEQAEAPPKPSRAPTRSLPSTEELDKVMADARAAMQDRDYDGAIRLYTKLLEYPEHPGRPQAQEYLGLARERKGQLAQAKLEYQEYLRRYPDGTDVDAVKQRLAAIITLEGATKPTRGAPDGSRWSVSGGLSQEYRKDQNSVVTSGLQSDGIGQSALNTDADLELHHRGTIYDFRARLFAGYVRNLVDIGSGQSNEVRLPAAYLELDNNLSHWVGRVGRQSQTAGGIYGTYDGAYFGWRVKPGLKLNFSVGAPIETYQAKLGHERVFGAISADFIGVRPGLDLTAFAAQQNSHGILDSRPIGLEARYYQDGHSVVGQLGYDISFRGLNSATILTSWALPARWMFTGVLDHRRSPFFGTYNALIGQQTTSLADLIQSLGIDAVRALARDRSATSDTLTLGVQRPLGERLQWGNDVSFSRVGSTRASGGVPAVPGSGTAISYSTQLIGGGWLVENDMNTVGLSFSTRPGTRSESLYGNARYPIGQNFRIGPRLQVSHTSGSDPTTGTTAGWSAGPSLMADWRFSRGVVQFESGYERATFNQSLAPGVPVDPTTTSVPLDQNTKRFWFSLGYNINF